VNDELHRALQLAPEKRAAFLDGACGSDESLRGEVEWLLSADEQAGSSSLQCRLVAGPPKGHRVRTTFRVARRSGGISANVSANFPESAIWSWRCDGPFGFAHHPKGLD
jgi:hypothetical protein